MRSIQSKVSAAVALCAVIAGCSSQITVKDEAMSVYRESPQRFVAKDPSLVPEYTLGFNDELEIKFFNNERFNENVIVRPDGRISLAKVGDIFVLGMTPSELDSQITATYSRIIAQPDVTVLVRKFGGYQVYVLGHVEKPGGYPIERNMTILQALTLAGGPRETAQLKDVILMRRNQDGQLNAYKFDLSQPLTVTHTRKIENDHYVYPTDVIYVPETSFASANRFLRQMYDMVLPPTDLYLRTLWYTLWLEN